MERKRKMAAGDGARRLDSLLRLRYPALSRRHLEEAIELGLVARPNGKRLAKGEKFLESSLSEEIVTHALDNHLGRLRQGNPNLAIAPVREESDYVVIDKPAGIPSHPIGLLDRDTVTHWAFSTYPTVADEFPSCQPTLSPHRLDTGTSGLLVVAKTAAAYAHWRALFRDHRITKRYLAWCWGNGIPDQWECEDSVDHDPVDPRKMIVGKRGYSARSTITVIKRLSDRFLCDVQCRTGVTHQVRVQLASRGFPLVGDVLYGGTAVPEARHHLLHAYSLSGPIECSLPSEPFTQLFS